MRTSLFLAALLMMATYAVPQSTQGAEILDGLTRIERIVDIHKRIISDQVEMMGQLAKLNDPKVNAIIEPRLNGMKSQLQKIDRIRLGKE